MSTFSSQNSESGAERIFWEKNVLFSNFWQSPWLGRYVRAVHCRNCVFFPGLIFCNTFVQIIISIQFCSWEQIYFMNIIQQHFLWFILYLSLTNLFQDYQKCLKKRWEIYATLERMDRQEYPWDQKFKKWWENMKSQEVSNSNIK